MLKIATIYHAHSNHFPGGIPKYVNELQQYTKRFDMIVDNYGYNKFAQNKSYRNKNILDKPTLVYNNPEELVEQLDKYDLVIMYLTPQTPRNPIFLESVEEFVYEVWKNISTTKVFQMHLSCYGSKIKNHLHINSILEYSDIVMSRSPENPVSKLAIEKYNKPWRKLKLYYDTSVFNKEHIKKKKIVSLGRPSGCKQLKYLSQNRDKLEQYMEVSCNDNYFGHQTGMKLLSESMICFAPTLAKCSWEYNNAIEYVQAEALFNDCILVLDKLQLENCYHNGIRWKDIPYFAIEFDKNNMQKTWDKIIEVINNEEERKKYTIAKEIFLKEMDINNFIIDYNELTTIK